MEEEQVIDISLDSSLYEGLDIQVVAGRKNLVTPVAEAIEVVGNNIQNTKINPEAVVLTGPMAVWAYLVVFHSVVHKTKRVYYDDGRNGKVLVAAHG